MKILFFTGKGGVGKSTLAASAAWQLSQQNNVLIVSLDPAHNLGDIFGVTLKHNKTRFTDSLFLHEIDLKKRSKEYLNREITVLSNTYKYLQALNLDKYFSVLKYSPGIEEYALLTCIEESIRTQKSFDYLIFDTPPTGLTLRFLALPTVTITWIDRLIQIRRQILEKRYTIHRIRGELSDKETILTYDENEDEALKRLKTLNKNYQLLTTILQSKDCSIILVYNPDLLSLKESQRLIEGLQDLNLPLRLLITNKVTEQNMDRADYVEKHLRAIYDVPVQRVALSETLLDGEDGKLYDIKENIISHF